MGGINWLALPIVCKYLRHNVAIFFILFGGHKMVSPANLNVKKMAKASRGIQGGDP